MRPSEHLHEIFYRIMARYMTVMEVNYQRPDFTVYNPKTLLVFLCMVFSCVCIIYTMATQTYEEALQSMCLLPYGIQGVFKYFFFCGNALRMRCIVEHLMSIHRQCDATDAEAQLLVKWSLRFKQLIYIAWIVMSMLQVAYVSMPLWVKLFTGEWVEILPVKLVGRFNDAIPGGIALNAGLHLMTIYLGINGVLAADVTFFMHVLHVCPLTELVRLKLRTLGDALRQRPQLASLPECSAFVDNCIRMHMEYVSYMVRVSETFYFIVMLEIGIDGICMCLFIYVKMMVVWYPLPALMIVFCLKLMVACALGTVSDLCFDEMWNALGEFPWYLLKQTDKQKFVMIYQRAQLPTVMMCGTLKLDMELFVMVMKNTLSVAMLLAQMTEESQ